MPRVFLILVLIVLGFGAEARAIAAEPALEPDELAKVQEAEQARIRAIASVQGTVVAIFGNDRMGGGSGVLISPDGLALTNFHVVNGAGEEGLAGLADGKLYRWKVIGLDPGGDLAVIQLADPPAGGFPFAPLGDSRTLRVGDWALAMGNPFVLAEDLKPTVTLGIISGLHRFQEGEGGKASKLLVYGDCIQVDSSINPGNSGGPLFTLAGQVVGINGRGSFEERGRVNVGVGYAISVNQIKNFIPDLVAGKVCMHATLDATFRDRDDKVICDSVNRDGVMGKLGLDLTDVLISFDGQAITSANQFNNLITTVPAHWPVEVVWEHEGKRRSEVVRLEALPYDPPRLRPPPRVPGTRPSSTQPSVATQPAATRPTDTQPATTQPTTRPTMRPTTGPATRPTTRPSNIPTRMPPKPAGLRQSEPGRIRDAQVNRQAAERLLRDWLNYRDRGAEPHSGPVKAFRQSEDIYQDGRKIGSRSVLWTLDGRAKIESADAMASAALRVAILPTAASPSSAPASARPGLDMDSATLIKMLIASYRTSDMANMELQGGDKAQRQRAYRLLLQEPSRQSAVFWFSVLGERDKLETRLLKAASADRMGNEGDPVMTFSDYRPVAGVMIPHRRTIVRGLTETPVLEIVTTSCAALAEVPAGSFPDDPGHAVATTLPAALSATETRAATAPAAMSTAAATMPSNDLSAGDITGNFLSDAIAYAQKRCVKILGASVGIEHGYATGIIVSPDGKILTAMGIYAVSPEELHVVMPDGRVLGGSAIHIVRRSEPLQALLLQVDQPTPDYFELPQTPTVRKGDWVAAVGNWFKVAEGAEPLSANLGVISLRAPMDTRHRLQDVNLEGDVLLIDAITANPGAPGGALITADGRLAGMIGKIVESKSTNTRINYALPADRLRLFLEGREPVAVTAATRGSDSKVGFSGIRIFLLGGPRAPAFIDAVVPGSPADKAGLQKDDLILRLDNDYVGSCKEYESLAAKWKAGVDVTLVVKRKNEILAVRLTLTGPPEANPLREEKNDEQP